MNMLIIEDEAAAARRLRKMVEAIDEKIRIIGELDSIEGAINWFVKNSPPDLVFLDIHLADGSAFELFNHIEWTWPVIFITAYDQYAVQAFKVNAVDYLLKPIKREELAKALQKFRLTTSQQTIDYTHLVNALSPKPEKRFLVKLGQQIKVIQARHIAYFYTLNKVTFAVTKEGRRYPVDASLDLIEESLDEKSFFRINRQFIIGFDAIEQMHAYSKSRVKIELQPACEIGTIVSTERSPHFKKWLVGE